jgi:hypothetical protein
MILISHLKVKKRVHALSSTQMSKLNELETAQCQKLMYFYICVRQGWDISWLWESSMIPINALDIGNIASEKCSNQSLCVSCDI